MALARAQWASEIAGEPMTQQNASLADDYTEFNGDFPTLLMGKAMSTRMGEVTPNDKAMFSDMQNARVQVYGDTAILTYNFAGLRAGRMAGQSIPGEVDARLCSRGRPVEARPRQFRAGDGRALSLEKRVAPARSGLASLGRWRASHEDGWTNRHRGRRGRVRCKRRFRGGSSRSTHGTTRLPSRIRRFACCESITGRMRQASCTRIRMKS